VRAAAIKPLPVISIRVPRVRARAEKRVGRLCAHGGVRAPVGKILCLSSSTSVRELRVRGKKRCSLGLHQQRSAAPRTWPCRSGTYVASPPFIVSFISLKLSEQAAAVVRKDMAASTVCSSAIVTACFSPSSSKFERLRNIEACMRPVNRVRLVCTGACLPRRTAVFCTVSKVYG
jgi:hypothetical protein